MECSPYTGHSRYPKYCDFDLVTATRYLTYLQPQAITLSPLCNYVWRRWWLWFMSFGTRVKRLDWSQRSMIWPFRIVDGLMGRGFRQPWLTIAGHSRCPATTGILDHWYLGHSLQPTPGCFLHPSAGWCDVCTNIPRGPTTLLVLIWGAATGVIRTQFTWIGSYLLWVNCLHLERLNCLSQLHRRRASMSVISFTPSVHK